MLVENIEFNIRRTGDVGASAINGLGNSLSRLNRSSGKAVSGLAKVATALKRIATYRVLRTIIAEIGKAFSEGLKNVYAYSSALDGALAHTLDNLKSVSTQFTNSLGSAFGELLQTIEPIIIAIINLATRVADAIARLFAVLGGRSTYSKAVSSAEKWADAAKGGAAAAKEWKNQLMGFDEINRLNDQNDGGGGGGGSPFDGAFEEAPAVHKWAEELRRITMDWWHGLNLEPIINAFNRLKTAVGNFVSIVDKGLRWAYENVLLPLAKWEIEKNYPAQLNLLASALEFLNVVLEKLAPYVLAFWEGVLKPFFVWCGEKFLQAVNWLTTAFEGLTQKLQDANSFSEFIKSLDGKETIVLSIAAAILTVVTAIRLLKTVSSVISTIGTLIGFLTSPIGLVILAIAGLIAIGILLYKNWETIKEKAIEIWGEITDWVNEKLDKFRTNLNNFGEDMGEFAMTITAPFRWICEGLEDIIATAQSAYNWLLRLFGFGSGSKASVSVPSRHSSSSYNSTYATGGFPEDGFFFANHDELVGQFSNGRTAVANNAQIIEGIRRGVKDGVAEAMLTFGNNNQEREIVLNVDGNAIARTVTKYQRMSNISSNA